MIQSPASRGPKRGAVMPGTQRPYTMPASFPSQCAGASADWQHAESARHGSDSTAHAGRGEGAGVRAGIANGRASALFPASPGCSPSAPGNASAPHPDNNSIPTHKIRMGGIVTTQAHGRQAPVGDT